MLLVCLLGHCTNRSTAKNHKLLQDSYMVGGTSLVFLSEEVIFELNNYLESKSLPAVPPDKRVQVFYRLRQSGQLYYSSKYGRVKKRNSFTILYRKNENILCGHIQQFMIVHGHPLVVVNTIVLKDSCHSHFGLVIKTLDKVLFPVQKTLSIDVIHISEIVEKCIYIATSDDQVYVSTFPNHVVIDMHSALWYSVLSTSFVTFPFLVLQKFN